MEYTARILMTQFVTHDTRRFIVERPAGYAFTAGQATDVSINTPQWKDEKRPFTFTSRDEDLALEFIIKQYPEHNGVTRALHTLGPGDELILRDVWGAITYQGPGVFIAGGAGITPFIAILRRLAEDHRLAGHRLIFSNKTARDVILEDELREALGGSLILTLTRESGPGYETGRIDKAFLADRIGDFTQRFYLCGPGRFVQDIQTALEQLGARPDAIVIET